jgi:hypothetical protein
MNDETNSNRSYEIRVEFGNVEVSFFEGGLEVFNNEELSFFIEKLKAAQAKLSKYKEKNQNETLAG